MHQKISDLHYDLGEFEFNLEADVTQYAPARPAPWCRNPDHPAYSDPGDDEYCEFTLFIKTLEGRRPISKMFPKEVVRSMYDKLTDEVYEIMRQRRENEREDALIERWEVCREVYNE